MDLFLWNSVASFGLQLGDCVVLGYLDPGTGSLVFQVLVASLVSAGVVFGGWMTQLRGLFARLISRRRTDALVSESTSSTDESVVPLHGEPLQKPEQHRKAA